MFFFVFKSTPILDMSKKDEIGCDGLKRILADCVALQKSCAARCTPEEGLTDDEFRWWYNQFSLAENRTKLFDIMKQTIQEISAFFDQVRSYLDKNEIRVSFAMMRLLFAKLEHMNKTRKEDTKLPENEHVKRIIDYFMYLFLQIRDDDPTIIDGREPGIDEEFRTEIGFSMTEERWIDLSAKIMFGKVAATLCYPFSKQNDEDQAIKHPREFWWPIFPLDAQPSKIINIVHTLFVVENCQCGTCPNKKEIQTKEERAHISPKKRWKFPEPASQPELDENLVVFRKYEELCRRFSQYFALYNQFLEYIKGVPKPPTVTVSAIETTPDQ